MSFETPQDSKPENEHDEIIRRMNIIARQKNIDHKVDPEIFDYYINELNFKDADLVNAMLDEISENPIAEKYYDDSMEEVAVNTPDKEVHDHMNVVLISVLNKLLEGNQEERAAFEHLIQFAKQKQQEKQQEK